MGLTLAYADGQTPLDEDEREGLLNNAITTQGELDELEQRNIEDAIQWTMMRKFRREQVLTEEFVKQVHVKMYSDVWKWAGKFRKTNKNLGVDKWAIGVDLRILLDDCRYWMDNKTYPQEEIAIRFKHRIVSIHCFPNGNGRHSRLMADIMVEQLFGQQVFSWGAANLVREGSMRTEYLKAVRAADGGDYLPLLVFARS